MTEEDVSKIRSFLTDKVHFDRACQMTEFEGYRRVDASHTQKITVKIFDSGPEVTPRYHIHAEVDGKPLSGNNPNDDLDIALAMVHWSDLDK
jgi:hypothetical protein